MASAIIHMVVANEINKKINRDSDKLLIGSIAPDISKFLGQTKIKSHFLSNENNDIPNIKAFLKKYINNLDDDFVLGYFIHLYTDYFWFKYFIPEIYRKNFITKLDGTVVKCSGNMQEMYIYNDYTNLNTKLLDSYNLKLDIFNNSTPVFANIIDEIPMEKIDIIINQVLLIIENSKTNKDLVFNFENIENFIKMTVELILSKLKEINIY